MVILRINLRRLGCGRRIGGTVELMFHGERALTDMEKEQLQVGITKVVKAAEEGGASNFGDIAIAYIEGFLEPLGFDRNTLSWDDKVTLKYGPVDVT